MSSSTRWLLFRHSWRVIPAAWGVIALASVLHLAVLIEGGLHAEGLREAQRKWGAALRLVKNYQNAEGKFEPEQDFYGPFELWDGELWRVFVSAFHHGDLLHLLLNSIAIACLGWFLEPRLGHWRFLRFFVIATLVSMVPEFLVEHSAIGLSGGAYALFGLLIVLRSLDEQLSAAIPGAYIRWGLIWLVMCIPITALGLMPIANLAHFSGFAYGWLFGQVCYGAAAGSRGSRWAFWSGHMLLLPALYFIWQPTWIGRYWWYRADEYRIARAAASDEEEQKRLLEQEMHALRIAVDKDPGLGRAWRQLVVLQLQQEKVAEAWKSLLAALDFNRSDPEGLRLAAAVWRTMQTLAERQAAVDAVKERFGKDAARWITRLGMRAIPERNFGRELVDSLPLAERLRLQKLLAASELLKVPWNEPESLVLRPRKLEAPPVDPDWPGSAQPEFPETPRPLLSGTVL